MVNEETVVWKSGGCVAGKKKAPSSEGAWGIGRRPTLPPVRAVPSARSGLTSLFGMGRGVPRRCNHRNLSPALRAVMGLTDWEESSPTGFCLFTEVRESIGRLVPLGFDIAAFTPAAYQRHRL